MLSRRAKKLWDFIEKNRIDMEESRKRIEADIEQSRKRAEKRSEKAEKEMEKFRVGMEELKASQKKTDEQMERTDKKLNKMIGDTGNNFGKLGENLVKGNLAKRLKEKGIEVEGALTNLKKGGVEYDIVAVNGKEVVVVEVKASLDPSDVEEFNEDIKQFTTLWPMFKKKTLYGAMAYLMKSNRQADSLAEKHGFFVISATGDVIIQNKKDFKPQTF